MEPNEEEKPVEVQENPQIENQEEIGKKKTNELAIVGMVMGLLSVVFASALLVFVAGAMAITAIILSSKALRKIKARNEKGKGMAFVGLILGIIITLYVALIIIFSALMVSAIMGLRFYP